MITNWHPLTPTHSSTPPPPTDSDLILHVPFCSIFPHSRMSSIDMKLSRYGHNKMSNFSVAEVTEKILIDTTELILDALQDDSPTTDARTSEINR